MGWQLREPELRAALAALVRQMGGHLVLAGAVGAQIHIAAVVGLDKRGPPASAIEVVPLRGASVPEHAGRVPVVAVGTLGFDASIEAGRLEIALDSSRYPVAAPEHILGMMLAGADLGAATKWKCFTLMRVLEGRLDVEEVRGFVKRSGRPESESLLHELAYLAA